MKKTVTVVPVFWFIIIKRKKKSKLQNAAVLLSSPPPQNGLETMKLHPRIQVQELHQEFQKDGECFTNSFKRDLVGWGLFQGRAGFTWHTF